MINKCVLNTAFSFDTCAAQVVPVARAGIESATLKKLASGGMFGKELADIKPKVGKTVIHVLAVGDEEFYGDNRNGDAFSGEDNQTAHTTFKTIGSVYRNHKSGDKRLSVGDVLATAHNPDMHRIELLLEADDQKASREVEAINRGEEVPVSMGSAQEYDVCSVCQHKAKTAADHCRHIKEDLGKVYEDGTKAYMRNPNPKYFDISFVWKPADRIAYGLRKVASHAVVGGHELAEQYGLGWANPKVATMRALAAHYKAIPGVAKQLTAPSDLSARTVTELCKVAKTQGVEQLIGFLHQNGWLLSPGDFVQIVVGRREPIDDCTEDPGGLEDGAPDLPLLDGADCSGITISDQAVDDLNCSCGMGLDRTADRSIRNTIAAPAVIKVANSVEQEGLRLYYRYYKVAFAHHHHDNQPIVRATAASM